MNNKPFNGPLTHEEAIEAARNYLESLKKESYEDYEDYREQYPESLLAMAFQQLADDILHRMKTRPDDLLHRRNDLGSDLHKILEKLKET